MRERRHQVGRDLEVFGLDEIDDARLVLGELGAPLLLDALEIGSGDQVALAALARQQDAAFLERLAHAGDAELELTGGDLVGAGAACLQLRIAVGLLQLAAGEHQRSRKGVDGVVADHHEDFERRAGVAGLGRAQQQDSGRRTGRRRFFLWRVGHARIVTYLMEACQPSGVHWPCAVPH